MAGARCTCAAVVSALAALHGKRSKAKAKLKVSATDAQGALDLEKLAVRLR
jgi:hypothetical protein